MNKDQYESRLEYRICDEFRGMLDGRLRGLWCDGVLLQTYLLDDPQPRILGIAWICTRQYQEQWDFELLLPRQFSSPDELNWDELSPPENMTRWLAIDQKQKKIQIEPAAAVPDLQ